MAKIENSNEVEDISVSSNQIRETSNCDSTKFIGTDRTSSAQGRHLIPGVSATDLLSEDVCSDEEEDDDKPICRICLFEEDSPENKLITPCKCSGTMKHIHVSCLREWLDSRKKKTESQHNKSYVWKNLVCELCGDQLPDKVFQNGKIHDILKYEVPTSGHYIILESFQEIEDDSYRLVLVIFFKSRTSLSVGRGPKDHIRIDDASISRSHALFKVKKIKKNKHEMWLFDNSSKFGTLNLLLEPLKLEVDNANYI